MQSKALKEQALRDALFVPCLTKEHLHTWIKVYLGLDLPDCIVCDDDIRNPPSNSSPMDLIWEMYSKALEGTDHKFAQILGFAARDSFKCVQRGTLILGKDFGLRPIEQIKVGDVIWSGKSWQPVEHWIDDGVKESVTVHLKNGASLTVSPIHRVWAWAPNEVPDWKLVKDLTSRDIVRWDTESQFGTTGPIDNKEFKIGYLCGILQGDGCLRFMESHGKVCLSGIDSHVLEFWKAFCFEYTGKYPKQSASRKSDWWINSVAFCKYLRSLDLTPSYSFEKDLPQRCLKNRSVLAGFISGLFDTDGHLTKKKTVEWSMTCEKLLRKLQIALAAMGVDSRFRSNNKIYPKQKNKVHSVIINGNELSKLFAAGVIFSARKANKLVDVITSDAHDSIPREQLAPLLKKLSIRGGNGLKLKSLKPRLNNYKTTTREKVRELIDYGFINNQITEKEKVFWEEASKSRWVAVESVTNESSYFFDLTVKEDHSYWSSGIISHNTLSAAIIEILCMFHLNRDVGHLAALEVQAKNCQSYVENFLKRPILREFKTTKNKREIEITRYINQDDGNILSPIQFARLNDHEKDHYDSKINFIKIVIATVDAANGLHVPFMVMDELDLADPAAFQEAKMIPTQGQERGEPAITFMTSTRKYSFGLVQKEIDNAHQSGLHVRHWNLIDVTEKCPASRHLPDEPKIDIHYSENYLRAITKEEWELLSEKEREQYDHKQGYAGCLKNCKIFAQCQGRLATKQTSRSKLLKTIDHTQTMFQKVNGETAKAQIMCWKPSSEGLIYPNFHRDIHVKSAAQMAQLITGDAYPINYTKAELVTLLKEMGANFYCGMDHGFTHNFSVITAALVGHILYVIDVISVKHLELQQKIDLCKEKIKHFNPTIYPDNAYPGDNTSFRKAGFKMVNFKKEVQQGIESIRTRLAPGPNKIPSLYFIAKDDGIELLISRLMQYHWKVDAAGRLTDEPDKDDDDELDALRYLCCNLPLNKSKMHASFGFGDGQPNQPPTQNDWMKRKIQELTDNSEEGAVDIRGKPGGFMWTF